MKGSTDMTEKMTESSFRVFSERLASKAPVPGGGGASAVIASLASSLCAMAAGLTAGKKQFLQYEEDLKRIIAGSEALRVRFLALVDEDAAAFELLSKAYTADRSDPENAERFTTATLEAARVPFEMMQLCCEQIALLEELRSKCSALLLSDVGCAAAALSGALSSASMNVLVNTRLISENEEANDLQIRAESMLHHYLPRAEAVSDSVVSFLKTGK